MKQSIIFFNTVEKLKTPHFFITKVKALFYTSTLIHSHNTRHTNNIQLPRYNYQANRKGKFSMALT